MIRIKFQNGPDAQEIFLSEEFETEAEAKKRLDDLVHQYGTVPEAVGWLEGEQKPKKLVKAEKELDEQAAELAEDPGATVPSGEPDAEDGAGWPRFHDELDDLADGVDGITVTPGDGDAKSTWNDGTVKTTAEKVAALQAAGVSAPVADDDDLTK